MADTIAAVSTAPMKSAIGIIRLSGDDSLRIARRVFLGKLENPREMYAGNMISKNGDVCDFGMGVYFKAPRSYTGEDCVELYCHGSLAVLRSVLSSLYSAGARPAEAGEFTKRAFLNGKMDLTQAEAVIDLIDSETEIAARNASEQMNGRLGREISSVSDELTNIAAEFYAFIDYPDDEISETDRATLIKKLREDARRTGELSASYENGRLVRSGVKTVLIGKPNAGKSSILNLLLGSERSIVTDTEGTTRDTVEEAVSINGLMLRLIDTAGIRTASSEPERLGIIRSERAAEESDLILAVFDLSREMDEYDLRVLETAKRRKSIFVLNKSDLAQRLDTSVFDGLASITVSAKDPSCADSLLSIISETVGAGNIACDGSTVTNPRHASALARASERISAAADALSGGFSPDAAMYDVEEALNILGELTGKRASENIISEIFSRFCVGK